MALYKKDFEELANICKDITNLKDRYKTINSLSIFCKRHNSKFSKREFEKFIMKSFNNSKKD